MDIYEEILFTKLPPVIPTVLDKIRNKILVIQFKDGTISAIENDRDVLDHNEYENMNEFEDLWGTIKDFKNIVDTKLGKILKQKFSTIANIWLNSL